MKINVIFYLCYFAALVFGCGGSQKAIEKKIDINFNTWKTAINRDFSNMLFENSKQVRPVSVDNQMINYELETIDTELMYKNWAKINAENSVKKWEKMILIYHELEGEVNITLTTFIFIDRNNKWGMTYFHNNGKYFLTKNDNISDVMKIKPALHGAAIGLGIISEFDKSMINIKNVLVAGDSFTQELAPLIKIYDHKIFE